jgi:hypothetical protein
MRRSVVQPIPQTAGPERSDPRPCYLGPGCAAKDKTEHALRQARSFRSPRFPSRWLATTAAAFARPLARCLSGRAQASNLLDHASRAAVAAKGQTVNAAVTACQRSAALVPLKRAEHGRRYAWGELGLHSAARGVSIDPRWNGTHRFR